MAYSATLVIPYEIRKIIEPEILNYKTDFKRVQVEFTNDSPLTVLVKADDSVSLRAVLNTISKLCTIYEKAEGIVNG